MADLITNLQSIYNTKLQIKEAIGTDSDVFADYPAYISAMGDSGYTYVTTNGDHSVNGYAYVNVNVPGATEYDHIEISANSQVNVAAYNYAYVSVPVPPGYIIPEGTYTATSNGVHDITSYSNVDVQVSSAAVLGNLSVTENGQYSASSYAYDGFDVVDVQVPQPTLGGATITANGIYSASDFGYDGLSSAIVNVPTGGSSIHDGLTPYTAFTVDELISYMKANYNPGDPQTANALYVKGKIANVIYTFSAQYPSWRGYLTNDGTFYYETENPSNYDLSKDLYVYGCFWESTQSQLWDSSVTPQVAVGDEVIILAPVAINSNGRVGTQNGYLYSHQKPVTGQLTVSQSGTYDVQNYVSAYVNVSGGSTPTMSVSGQYGVYNSKYYIYDTNNYTYLTFNGPLANMNLGDTVSGTAEYVDFDGSGMIGSYLFKNFVGTGVQDPNRVYTNFTVGSYYNNSQQLISTINGSVSSQSTDLYSSGGMMTTYSLPSNYSGPTFEAGSTVYCYVSTTNAMAMTQNLINEVVSVINPTLTGMSYSTDSGATWNSMNYNSLTGSYSVSGLSKSISAGSSDNSIYIRQEFDNATYKYVSPYIEFNSGSTSPIQTMVTPNTMMSAIQFYNMSGATEEITGIEYSVNSNYISVSFQQGISYGYRIVATDSTGVPTGSTYDMMNEPARSSYKYHLSENDSAQYFYIQKYVISGSGTEENYKPELNTEIADGSYNTSTSGTGVFIKDGDTRFWIYFNVNTYTVERISDTYLELKSGGATLLKVYGMDSGGNRLTTTGVTGCSFFDGNNNEYKPDTTTFISSGYDGALNITTSGTGLIDFSSGTFMMYYYDDPMNGKNVYIHDEATV